jgi:hypothetical protein
VIRGRLGASLARAAVFLRELDLLAETQHTPDYSRLTPSQVRQMPYPRLWEMCIRERWFDIRMMDESFFQFRLDAELSFCYYEAPIRGKDFETFAFERGGDEWREFDDVLRDEYEEYLTSLPRDWPATPIRFDFSPSFYKTPCHPAAHIHFGFASDIRVASRRVFSPEAFVLFVVRQCYPDHWRRLVDKHEIEFLTRRIRDALPVIEDKYWCETDECETYLY